MTQPGCPHPSAPAARPPSAERSAQIVALAVLGLALVAVLLVGVLRDGASGGVGAGAPGPGGLGGSGGSGPLVTGGSTATTRAGLDPGDPDAFLRGFPLPPGGHHLDTKYGDGPDSRYNAAPGSVGSVKSFYDGQVPQLGLEWRDPQPSEYGGEIQGWSGPLYQGEDLVGFLQFSQNPTRNGRQRTLIVVSVQR